MKTGSLRVSLGAIAASIALSGVLMFSTGCVVAATGTNTDVDDKSQTEQLDTSGNTTAGSTTPAKLPDYGDTKASGGQGGGPDPSPWRATIAAENGGPNGPDPSPWDPSPSGAASNTRK